ncbi:MAG: DNA primase [Bacteroidetes bacterium]|nr:DNA primase [Bacteroidota bacterium]
MADFHYLRHPFQVKVIPKFTIARIMEEARIDEVVGEFVTLKKRGSSLIGNCPFHNEKTPSFNVSVSRGIYKCFGCGKAGNSVTFLMESQQMTYVEALKYLAKKYNIEIVEEYRSEEQKKEEDEKQSLTESILIANAYGQRFFTDYLLHNEKGAVGLSYFKERGFSTQTIEKFQLGFAPESGTEFTETALKAGYQLDILKKAGLTSPKEGSKYDFFRNRVMFPVHNLVGKVIAFGGRIMVKDEKSPKYVNTGESEVYVKSKILYGIYQAKGDIRKQDECLLVEGYTDVISLVQAGIDNVVASSGTALTTDQIRLIKRFTHNVTILYDGDAAGIKAALRGTDMVLEEGLNVRIVILPDQEDPDSYVRRVGATAFTEFIKENKKDLILFKTDLYATEAKSDPVKKADMIRDIVQSISRIPDMIQRSVYIQQCAHSMQMSEQILVAEVNKMRNTRAKEKTKEDVAPHVEIEDLAASAQAHQEQLLASTHNPEPIERDIVRALIEYGTWEVPVDGGEPETATQFIFDTLEGILFESKYKYAYDYIRSEFDAGRIHPETFYTQHSDVEISRLAIDLVTASAQDQLSPGWWEKYEVIVPDKKALYIQDIISSTMRMKQMKNLEMLYQIEERMRTAESAEQMDQLIQHYKLLTEQKKEFAKATGIVVYKRK